MDDQSRPTPEQVAERYATVSFEDDDDTTEDPIAVAFNAGCDARLAGWSAEENPYNPSRDTYCHRSWRSGWHDVNDYWGKWLRGVAVPPLPQVRAA